MRLRLSVRIRRRIFDELEGQLNTLKSKFGLSSQVEDSAKSALMYRLGFFYFAISLQSCKCFLNVVAAALCGTYSVLLKRNCISGNGRQG